MVVIKIYLMHSQYLGILQLKRAPSHNLAYEHQSGSDLTHCCSVRDYLLNTAFLQQKICPEWIPFCFCSVPVDQITRNVNYFSTPLISNVSVLNYININLNIQYCHLHICLHFLIIACDYLFCSYPFYR